MKKMNTQPRRYVPIAEFQRMTGLSYPTIKNALETGQLNGIRTGAGHWKVDTEDVGSKDVTAIVERLNEQGQLLKALCGHLGLSAERGWSE